MVENNAFFSKILPAKLQRVKLLQIGRYQLRVLSLTPTLFSYLFSFLLDMTSSLILVSYVIFSHYVIFSIFLSSYKKSSFNSLTFVYLPFGVTLLSKKGRPGIHLSSVPPLVVSMSRLNGRDHCLRFLSRPSRACLHPSFYNWLYTYTLMLVCSTLCHSQHAPKPKKEHFRLKSVQLG